MKIQILIKIYDLHFIIEVLKLKYSDRFICYVQFTKIIFRLVLPSKSGVTLFYGTGANFIIINLYDCCSVQRRHRTVAVH